MFEGWKRFIKLKILLKNSELKRNSEYLFRLQVKYCIMKVLIIFRSQMFVINNLQSLSKRL